MHATLIGHVDVISHGVIAGWAADSVRPQAKVAVDVIVNGASTEVRAGRPRHDLKTLFEGATGEYGFRLGESPLPLSPFIENRIEIRFAADGAVVPGGMAVLAPLGTRQPISARAGGRTPIVVTTTGRSGSSLLMARLAQHPDILVGRNHPHELKLLSYYALALNTLVAEADRERSTNPDNMLAAKRFFVGFNPFNDDTERRDPDLQSFWKESSPDILRACFVALIDAYYDRVAHRKGRHAARFFAEKIGTSELARHAASFMYGTLSEIVLVRDPRDVICSARSFWNRNAEKSMIVLRNGLRTMALPRVESGLRQHVVRYEDLVLKPQETMDGVCAFLGLACAPSPLDVERESRVFLTHGTSPSATESIGRWRRELSAAEIALANREFSAYLVQHGYAIA